MSDSASSLSVVLKAYGGFDEIQVGFSCIHKSARILFKI